ncbi:putative metalloendopeptidase, partial [Operophtera brumata]
WSHTMRKVVSFIKRSCDVITRMLYAMLRNGLSQDTAACALSVRVGSYSDPSDIQGLAHFVEHMVFMGSEKYPKENEFDSFIKITEKHLPHAMDIFSNFFVSPLMKKEAMQRERETIESEFAIASPSNSNRKDQLLCSLFPETHPARTFTWGNLKSLRDDVGDDERLHRAAHDFRKRHYSANRMTVAVQARMELPLLEQYVINTFGRIPSNKLPADDFDSHAFKPDNVHLTWCMRSLIAEYESKPHQYISYLLGHEGKGSLLSYLRKKVWALGIYTGNSESGIDYTTMYSLFSTQVVLTKEGLNHIDEAIEETNFRFEEESQPADYVENLVENMHFYPPQHYITGDKLYYKYDPKRWTNVEPYPNFHLPNKNIYITTDFSLIAPAQPYLDAAADLGIDLHNTSMKDIRKKAVESENMKKTLKHGELIAAVENF